MSTCRLANWLATQESENRVPHLGSGQLRLAPSSSNQRGEKIGSSKGEGQRGSDMKMKIEFAGRGAA